MDEKIQIVSWLEYATHDMEVAEKQFSRVKEMYQWLLSQMKQ